jgi:translation initiation factor 2B subunit (eIF-2B alpha/beta/delta family)
MDADRQGPRPRYGSNDVSNGSSSFHRPSSKILVPMDVGVPGGDSVGLGMTSLTRKLAGSEKPAHRGLVRARTRASRWGSASGADLLDSVRRDRVRGATELSRRALSAIAVTERSWQYRSPRFVPRALRLLADRISHLQPGMGAFLRWGRELRAMSRVVPPERLLFALKRWIREWHDQLERENDAVARVALRRLPKRVRALTISASQNVAAALTLAGGRQQPRVIYTLASEPGGEGRRLARILRRKGVHARVVEDSAASRFVPIVDLVLVGADAVLNDGSLIHKVGTRPVARWARRAGVPFVSLAGRSKIVRGPPFSRVKIPILFDRTPALYVAEYWTDIGPLAPSSVSRGLPPVTTFERELGENHRATRSEVRL